MIFEADNCVYCIGGTENPRHVQATLLQLSGN